MTGAGVLTLAGSDLTVTIDPRVGGTVTGIVHRASRLSVLGAVPWDPIAEPIGTFAARDEAEWLSRYSGGWPLLLPNGGDACQTGGVFHGFHGEASVAPWVPSVFEGEIRLTRRFFSVPVAMERVWTLAGEELVLSERLRMSGPEPVDIMWGQHPTFGSDLLAGPVEVSSGARRVTADDAYDPCANPLQPGASGNWPFLPGKAGVADLAHPRRPNASLAYLHDFETGWIVMRRLDDAIAVRLAWDAKLFPCLWLWCELGGTTEAPWFGRGNLVGLEPNTTWPGTGLAQARRRGSRLLKLEPETEVETEFRLRVFKPDGPISPA